MAIVLITQILIQPGEIYLGYFPRNQRVKLTFKIINRSREPVKIRRVMPFCSCLKISHYDSIIYPFSEIDVGYSFDSRGMSGPFRKEVLIQTDRFGYQFLKFAISGIVCDPPVEPTVLSLRNGIGRVRICHSFWNGKIKIVDKPDHCWTGLREERKLTELLIYSYRRPKSGAVKISIGRKIVTIPITIR